MNPLVPSKAGNFVISWTSISFQRKALRNWVCFYFTV